MKRSHLAKRAAIAFSLIASAGAYAQQVPEGVILFTPAKAQWAATVTAGALPGPQQAFIHGHVSKPGPYLYQVKFPANFKAHAHTHPDTRGYTVLSGTWYVGFGTVFDESKLIPLPAGSYITEPANVPHFVATKEPVLMQISGNGPSRLTFVNPAHAPAAK
jgi:quercetin dioxygenase-like cupin family protein